MFPHDITSLLQGAVLTIDTIISRHLSPLFCSLFTGSQSLRSALVLNSSITLTEHNLEGLPLQHMDTSCCPTLLAGGEMATCEQIEQSLSHYRLGS